MPPGSSDGTPNVHAVHSSPNAAFAALSARWSGKDGITSDLNDIEKHIRQIDDENLTAALDRKCRALKGMGLSKVDKVSLDSVAVFKTTDNIYVWLDQLFLDHI